MARRMQLSPEQSQIGMELREMQKIQQGTLAKQVEMVKTQEARRKYVEKKSENEEVLKEFQHLSADSTVYKLVGPVLARQEVKEAKQTVEKRVAYINKELVRIDKVMEGFEKQIKAKRDRVIEIQQMLRREGLKRNKAGPIICRY
eukprot:TRINITY_DN9361_c0_g4_i3.p2 TRINITY_DN9361_c0_g4~~TRINITY_DN9361_c0_g4_i3.p2  ORF type:complete len:145 (-),score=46.32 TRINITY_DN9361_c0_g4_i3:48-482(-)